MGDNNEELLEIDDLSEPDYNFLASAEKEEEEEEVPCSPLPIISKPISNSSTTTSAEAPSCSSNNDDIINQNDDYILGTLTVRIKSARNINMSAIKQHNSNALSSLLSPLTRSNTIMNPFLQVEYAMSQHQRTTQLYNTGSAPSWPRLEQLFFDVLLPLPRTNENKDAAKTKKKLIPNSNLVLTLCHSEHSKKQSKQNEVILTLGSASINTTVLITGKEAFLDVWLPLFNSNRNEEETDPFIGEVRVILEYEPTDPPPKPGDLCQFILPYCSPYDIYPITPFSQVFSVVATVNIENRLTLSYVTNEGWVCTFPVHLYMIIVIQRHDSPAILETLCYNLQDLSEKLMVSPMAHTLQHTIKHSVMEDGLLDVSKDVLSIGWNVAERWMEHGFHTAVDDIVYAMNLDGKHAVTHESIVQEEETQKVEDDVKISCATLPMKKKVILPGMPNCPITGEPMSDPVVAADGYTYERSAIMRWFQDSDRSPMTGVVLSHKDLVPNYTLLSTYQE